MRQFKEWAIPESWKLATIKNLGQIVSGGTPSSKIPEYWGGSINWITPADLSGYKKKFIAKGKKSLTNEGLKNSSARLMPAGSVHFSSRAPVGYVVISSETLSTNQGFKSLIPSSGLSKEYLYYYLKSAKQIAEEMATGTTFKEISGRAFGELPVPLAPTEEQHCIAEKIEELFSELDNGIENLKRARAKLKTYRQAVLKYAFEGKLTEAWRTRQIQEGNPPEPAEKLLERIRKEREKHYQRQLTGWKKACDQSTKKGKKKPARPKKPKDLQPLTEKELAELPEMPEGWRWVRINESVFDLNNDIVDGPFGSNLKNSDYVDGGTVPVIGISNIDEGFKTKIRYVTKEKFETISRSAV